MAKAIKYLMRNSLLPVEMPWTEANEAIVKAEAHNGEYTIEDDGIAAEEQPSQEQRIAELEAALEMILSGVTE